MKVVYNNCYGGFGLSHAGMARWAELSGIKLYPFHSDDNGMVPGVGEFWTSYCTTPEYSDENHFNDHDIKRNDPCLVQVVEEMGQEAADEHAALAIRDVPKGAKYRIDEYDGNESVMLCDEYEWETAE